MTREPTSTVRARRFRERRSRGIAMVASVEIGEGGVAALEQWSGGHGAQPTFK